MTRTVAALYVAKGGCYFGLPDVDPWDEARDARLYDGPWPVVAHPPCGRWCQLAPLVEHVYGYKVGDDGGCFEAALFPLPDVLHLGDMYADLRLIRAVDRDALGSRVVSMSETGLGLLHRHLHGFLIRGPERAAAQD